MKIFLLILFASMNTLGQSFFKANHTKLSLFDRKLFQKDSLNVYLGNSENPILGKKTIKNDSLFFEPIVPFSYNQKYKVVYKNEVFDFFLKPSENKVPLKILAIYPLSDSLPNNILKFYIEFSEPIADGQIYQKIKLYDADNQEITEAFVNLGIELWDENRTRLTLWIDPGRVKTHLLRNENEGEVLEKNKNYRIKIEANILSRKGNMLQNEVSKNFITTEAIRNALDWGKWKILATQNQIEVQTDRLMDFATMQKMIKVFDKNTEEIVGKWAFGTNEKVIIFSPEKTLEKGKFSMKINTLIEDVSANNINTAFDRNIKTQKRNNKEFVKIKFNVK